MPKERRKKNNGVVKQPLEIQLKESEGVLSNKLKSSIKKKKRQQIADDDNDFVNASICFYCN